jgi:hypothetical protein
MKKDDFELNLNIPLKSLKGEDITGQGTIGEMVGNTIVSETEGDSVKIFGWALKLVSNDRLVLDVSDKKALRELIEKNSRMTILLKAQALNAFE